MKNDENKKIENVINLYMLANNLKYTKVDKNQSLADQVYGSMILATAINSEYNIVNKNNLGDVLKTILFKTIIEHFNYETKININEFSLNFLKDETTKLFNSINQDTSIFSFSCTTLEEKMGWFFEQFLIEENIQTNDIEKLYNIAKNYGLTDIFGNDNTKNFEIFRFYYLNRILKQKIRSGWDSNHWNVSSSRIERISEHCIGTIALAIALNSQFKFDININKIITTLCVHEIGEIKIGDITPFDNITPEQKQEIEHKAIIEVVGNLSNKDTIINSIFNFDGKETYGDKFAYYCDKLEADIQAKVYQDMGFQHPLTEQQNNVVFKSSKVQAMVKNGATTAFDIWCEWDKDVYKDEPVFTKILNYVKNNSLKNN